MKKQIHPFLAVALVLVLLGCQNLEDRGYKALEGSAAWLWAQQSSDGGWHSQTHAVLKDGKALTPYILYYLLQVPDEVCPKPAAGVEAAIAFIQQEIRSSMQMGPDSLPMLNYPNYSAAYALRVLAKTGRDTALQNILEDHLLREQFVEHRGITSDHLAYGGWGYGEPGLPYGEHGHVDISHTRRILEALFEKAEGKAVGVGGGGRISNTKYRMMQKGSENNHLAFVSHNSLSTHNRSRITRSQITDKVQLFLQGVQRTPADTRLYEGCISRAALPYDGGFISSSVTLSTNKSVAVLIEGAGYHYPSYATATCDGLLALHALGLQDSQAFQDAKEWLTVHQHINTIDGLDPEDPEMWVDIMHYYHMAVRAEAMSAAAIPGPWAHEIIRILVNEQQAEGYYVNPVGGVNKEDDPLMATILAVQALHFIINENTP